MDLILWRHAEAEKEGSDDTRALTAYGRSQAASMAAWLKPRLPEKVRVLVSPALRARQTAEALAQELTAVPELAYPDPGASVAAVLKAAGWPDAEGTVIVVGHQPILGQTAAAILSEREEPWRIPTGGIWWFTSGAEGAEKQPLLRAVMPPDLV
jgi:phosphohistidine phosphatase